MATGTVKWFNTTKGYGFICPDDGKHDIFVHATALAQSGITIPLKEGQRVSFDTKINQNNQNDQTGQKKVSAINLKIGEGN